MLACVLIFMLAASKPLFGGEVVEALLALITSEHRGKPLEESLYLSDLRRERLFFLPPQTRLDRKAQIQRLIHHRLLLREAKRFVLEKPSEKAVTTRLTSIRRRFPDQKAFESALVKTGLQLDELKSEIRGHLWVEALLKERIRAFIFITPRAISDYYRSHPDSFPGRRLEEVEPVIQSILSGAKERQKQQEYLERLKEKVHIEILFKPEP